MVSSDIHPRLSS